MPEDLRALVYRPGALGDTLVSLPAIAEIRRRFPAHRLSLLTEQVPAGSTRVSAWAVLRETGWFDEVFQYTVHASTVRERWQNVRLAASLRAKGFDAIFSLAPPRTKRQLRADAAIFRRIIGANRYYASAKPAWPLSAVPDDEVQHEAVRLLKIVDPGAADDVTAACRLPMPLSGTIEGERVLDELDVHDDDLLVGVAPASGRASTTWPADRFLAVGEALLRQFANVVLLAVGGAGDRSLCDDLCRAWGARSRNLAGRLSVFGSASVLSRCAAFIGNDSGPTHLAALVGTPCVAIFSARNAPGQWMPLGRDHVILEDRPECAGCMLDDCVVESNKCLLRISAGRVVREAASVIQSRAAS